MQEWMKESERKLDRVGYCVLQTKETQEQLSMTISPKTGEGKTNMVVHMYFPIVGMVDIRVYEESAEHEVVSFFKQEYDIDLDESTTPFTHPEVVKKVVFEIIEAYAEEMNIQALVVQNHPFIAEAAKQAGFKSKDTYTPFVTRKLSGYAKDILVKVRSLSKWIFSLSYNIVLVEELTTLQETHPEVEYNFSGLSIVLYYAGKTQKINWDILKGKCTIEYAEKPYVVTSREELREVLVHIISETEEKMRIKNLLNPPKRHFNEYLKELTDSTREAIHQLLLQKMTIKEIEKMAAIMKKQPRSKQTYDEVELVSFHTCVVTLEDGKYQDMGKKEYKTIQLLESKEQVETVIVEKERQKIKAKLEELFLPQDRL